MFMNKPKKDFMPVLVVILFITVCMGGYCIIRNGKKAGQER